MTALNMEDSNTSQGVDSLQHSTLTSQRNDSAYSHDVEKQPDLNNSALDLANHDEKAPKDPNIVDWDGPDDPENPLNWTSNKKLAAITIVALCTMLS